MKKVVYVLLSLLLTGALAAMCWLGYKIYGLSHERTELKKDYAVVNNIEYGLLSVDAWRDHITAILTVQINEFDFNKVQRDTLKKEINKILFSLINEAEDMINEKPDKLDAQIKRLAVKTFVNTDKIRARVPEFSESIIKELTKPQTRQRLQFLAKDKLGELASKTRDSLERCSTTGLLLTKHQCEDTATFNPYILKRIDALQEKIYTYSFMMIGIVFLYLLVWRFVRNEKPFYKTMFTFSVLLAIALLGTGLTAPMIEIDARIKELNFLIAGDNIIFRDQVIFYESKSILDVVIILVETKKADSVFVGILLLCFSVLFPVAKLLATKAYLLGNEKWKSNKFITFFAFKSGKWSMADVMVVAIFMAYIGFKGILDSQLENINFSTNTLSSIATNETSLQPGFILFIAYVLFGLILSVILKNITGYSKFSFYVRKRK